MATGTLTNRDAAFLAGGIAVGALIGGFAVKQYLEPKYRRLAEEEISDIRDYYNAKAIVLSEKPKLEALVKELGYDPGVNGGPTPEDVDAAEVERNVFEQRDYAAENAETWDYDRERANRSSEAPYILHIDEFTENETQYEQQTYTYYEGDDVLSDENDQVVNDRDSIVGEVNLGMFGTGHGSGNEHVLYVRNDRLAIDFELVRSEGKYAEEVHGFIEHSDYEPRRRRPRFDDE